MKQNRRPAIDAQAARHVDHVERSGADLRRGGRRRGRAAGVLIVDRKRCLCAQQIKQALLALLGENDIEHPVLYSEHLIGDGQQVFEHAAKLNWEGVISKRADAVSVGAK